MPKLIDFLLQDGNLFILQDNEGNRIIIREVDVFPSIPTHVQSKQLSVLVEDPLFFSTRTFSDRLTDQLETYTHQHRAIGGFWSAGISINDSQEKIEDWIERGLGRHISTHNPALEVAWEGFVNKITVRLGFLEQFEVGPLLNIGNRVNVRYSVIVDDDNGDQILGGQSVTTAVNNTDSQGRYGIISKTYSINGATNTQATDLRDQFVNDRLRSFPNTSGNSNLEGGETLSIKLDCLGYWHFLKAYYYENDVSGQQNLNLQLRAILEADPNNIFSNDFSFITENTRQVSKRASGKEKAETILKRLNAGGDESSNPYTIGCYAGQVFKYRQVPSTLEFQQRITTNEGVTDAIGNKVNVLDVDPAEWIFYPDFLVGRHPPISRNTLGSDPRSGFIETVKFTAPQQISINGRKLSQLDQALAQRGMGGMG